MQSTPTRSRFRRPPSSTQGGGDHLSAPFPGGRQHASNARPAPVVGERLRRSSRPALRSMRFLAWMTRRKVSVLVVLFAVAALRRHHLRSRFERSAFRDPGRCVAGVRPGDARRAARDVQSARRAARPLHTPLERDRCASAGGSGLAARPCLPLASSRQDSAWPSQLRTDAGAHAGRHAVMGKRGGARRTSPHRDPETFAPSRAPLPAATRGSGSG